MSAAEVTERTEPVRLSALLVKQLRVIAAAGRKTMGEVIEELAGDEIRQAYAAVLDAAASANELGNHVG